MRKIVLCSALLLATVQLLSGCVANAPLVLENGFQRKIITLCDNDVYCFRTAYSVTWDRVCSYHVSDNTFGCVPGYPVTYRSKEYSVETGEERYAVRLPDAGEVRVLVDNEEK